MKTAAKLMTDLFASVSQNMVRRFKDAEPLHVVLYEHLVALAAFPIRPRHGNQLQEVPFEKKNTKKTFKKIMTFQARCRYVKVDALEATREKAPPPFCTVYSMLLLITITANRTRRWAGFST